MKTINVSDELYAKLEVLAKTNMNDLPTEKEEKTMEEITAQAVERGISAIQQTRKQYQKQQLLVKLGKAAQASKK